jgi:hypothetical protein
VRKEHKVDDTINQSESAFGQESASLLARGGALNLLNQ